jgi:enoyl reductase-like protein
MSFYGRYAGFMGGGGGGGGGTAPLADKEAISNGATSVAVSFGSTFGAAPVVVAWLTSSDVNPDQLAIIGTAVDQAGFTVLLSSAAPNGTYTLNWMASAVNN